MTTKKENTKRLSRASRFYINWRRFDRTDNISARNLPLLITLKNEGYAETTLKGISEKLEHLSKYVDLDNPEMKNLFCRFNG